VVAVRLAGKNTPEVKFWAVYAPRCYLYFLCGVFVGVVAAGATTNNLPYRVGYATPY
jgi:hypothetical protein